nr:hypothetical protein [Deinococcus misasensis]
MFERYFCSGCSLLGEEPGGTGLPIAKWIVEGHGGEIRLQSELGVETEVVDGDGSSARVGFLQGWA